LTQLVGRQKEHPAYKEFSDSGAGVVICLERGANDWHYGPAIAIATHSPLASLKPGLAFTFRVPAYPCCPAKEAVKRVSVCLSVTVYSKRPERLRWLFRSKS